MSPLSDACPGQWIAGISVSAPVWFCALRSPEEMSRLRGELDREAAREGGRIWSYEPQGSRGRDAGGRPIFDTLAPVREFVFWVVASCGGINCSFGTATPCCLDGRLPAVAERAWRPR